ncbi:hypothetical protein PSN45_003101 [Yamadazyma tenuis]|nr:hypothetical protein PSN45_003101 [Yamadazyma tenuis]
MSLAPAASFDPQSHKLLSTLSQLQETLYHHKHVHTRGGNAYTLAPNFADYVFFPLSNLLKQSVLSDQIITNILHIISFLIDNCWVPNGQFSDTLADQLFPVTCYLIKGSGGNIEVMLQPKSSEFRMACTAATTALVRGVDRDYFAGNDMKRLSLLGDTSSVLLALLKSFSNPRSLEESETVKQLLEAMTRLFVHRIGTEKLTHIFPGVVSTLIAFVADSATLHWSTITEVVDLLRKLVVRVFDDKTLGVEPQTRDLTPDSLNHEWENGKENEIDRVHYTANVSVDSGNEHTSQSWLKATSKKLKLSLNTLFKSVLFQAHRGKVGQKQQLGDSIVFFVRDIYTHCFWSLFDELFALNIDVLCLVSYSRCYPDIGPLDQESQTQVLTEIIAYIEYAILHKASDLPGKLLTLKLEDLIDNKMVGVMKSTSEDRILQFFVSLRFHFLLLKKLDPPQVQQLIQRQIVKLKGSLVDVSVFTGAQMSRGDKKDFFKSYTGDTEPFENDNKLDNVQLPPYVNANNLKPLDNRRSPVSKKEVVSDLLHLSQMWTLSGPQEMSSLCYFEDNFSSQVETALSDFLSFLNGISTDRLLTLETLISGDTSHMDRGISLWLANQLVQNMKSEKFDIDEFLVLGDTEKQDEPADETEEMAYLIVNQSQELIEDLAPFLEDLTIVSTSKEEMLQNKMNEKSYAVALDSLGVLSSYLPKDEFKEHFLIEYLFPLFEALTFNSNTVIQSHAKNTVSLIAKNYYGDSLTELVLDNSEYLVDAVSLKLTSPGALTPALPGILLIILKVSGLKLLLTNQLSDILSQIFILIDSYHGYAILVEGFFIVFGELVAQIKQQYIPDRYLRKLDYHHSLYKPWGMTSIEEARALVDESRKVLDPFEGYDREKEYFHRSQDAPFSQLQEQDKEVDENPPEKEEIWTSMVPKNIYFIVQRVFIYGLRLLSHPSDVLKIQLLKILIDIYPILSTNYSLTLPLAADHWSDILALFPHQGQYSEEAAIKGLEFLTLMLETDRLQKDTFFSERFLDSCRMLLQRFSPSRHTSEVVKIDRFKRSTNVRLLKALCGYLVTGLNNYERSVPIGMAIQIMRIAMAIGTDGVSLGPQARNIAWVIRNQDVHVH